LPIQKKGGSILIGVDEKTDSDGKQKAKIVGCKISDKNRNKIITKAQNCTPQIEIEIIKENMGRKPFYRIEIHSGDKKPYCTGKGIYKIRDDGNNKALKPEKLLSIFVETESEIFLKRFKTAAKELESALYDSLDEIQEVKSYLENILPQVEELQEYGYLSDDILGKVNEIHKEVVPTNDIVGWNEERILKLLNHFNIEDPYVTNLKTMFKKSVIRDSKRGINIKDKNYLKEKRDIYHGSTEEQLKQWHKEVIEELK